MDFTKLSLKERLHFADCLEIFRERYAVVLAEGHVETIESLEQLFSQMWEGRRGGFCYGWCDAVAAPIKDWRKVLSREHPYEDLHAWVREKY